MSAIWPAQAADGLYLPSAPTGPGGEDSITTSQGVRCSQSINSNGGYVDVGVVGGTPTYPGAPTSASDDQVALGYARIIIPLGERPRRLDCQQLYELEIQRLREEIRLLSIGLE